LIINDKRNAWRLPLVAALIIGAAYYAWRHFGEETLPDGIAKGNGRIEAVEIDISTLTAGRLDDILVREGDFVTAGQTLAQMDTDLLEAQRREAEASLAQARVGVETAETLVRQSEAEQENALAVIAQREAQLRVAQKQFDRSLQLSEKGNVSDQVLDNDRATLEGANAALASAKAQLAAAEAGISVAKAKVISARAAVDAAVATIDRIQTSIDDSTLTSPRDGRVQFRVAQPGEVLGAGGRVLNLVDLGDVYMTFFLPTTQAGRLSVGSEARIILDAAANFVIPAKISYVADVAQFTPKTVETEEERQKLMFRVRAQISPDLLKKHITRVKTGLPGTTYVKLDPNAEWPTALEENLVE
jgi:HlyD family secretion protein